MWAELDLITPSFDPWSRTGDEGLGGLKRRQPSAAEESEAMLPKWARLFDQTTVSYYYFNNYTGECSSDVPRDFVEPADPSLSYVLLPPDVKATLVVQNAYRARRARRVQR